MAEDGPSARVRLLAYFREFVSWLVIVRCKKWLVRNSCNEVISRDKNFGDGGPWTKKRFVLCGISLIREKDR